MGFDSGAKPFSYREFSFAFEKGKQCGVYGVVVVHRAQSFAAVNSNPSFLVGDKSSTPIPTEQRDEILGDAICIVRKRLPAAARGPQIDHGVPLLPNLTRLRAGRMLSAGTPCHVAGTSQGGHRDNVCDSPEWVDSVQEPSSETEPAGEGLGDLFLDKGWNCGQEPIVAAAGGLAHANRSDLIEQDAR